eukprot:snap_masked-scaffold_48-processed-gene-1.127-mRNA-1 protein AED:1.00 eAED:1.00 QI:0/-1/0/0/-1/1/1/0/100
MKPLNKITIKSALQLPMLENLINRTLRAKVYGGFDIKSGYDQVKVSQESRKYFGLMTPWGTVYHQCSCPKGWTNSPMLFHQSVVEEVCKSTGFFMGRAME